MVDATFKETPEAWVIEVDMPGVTKDKVKVSAVGRILEVRGERAVGLTYSEAFQLPDLLSADQVSAELDLGVLTLKVPKRTPLAITVTTH